MSYRFKPYCGNDKHVFISYSRADFSYVLDVIFGLYESKYRLWYDEGIPAGDDWPAYIERNLISSTSVVFFASKKSFVSPNCYSEIKAAFDNNKEIICVCLDDTSKKLVKSIKDCVELSDSVINEISEACLPYLKRRASSISIPVPNQWYEVLQSAHFIDSDDNPEITRSKILESGIITKEYVGDYQENKKNRFKLNGWVIAVILSLIVMCLTVYYSYSKSQSMLNDSQEADSVSCLESSPAVPLDPTIYNNIPNTNVEFPDTLQESAIRNITQKTDINLSIERNDLKDVTDIYICGATQLTSDEKIRFSGGNWYAGKSLVAKGSIKDLSVIGQIYYLQNLSLVYQEINNINCLKDLNYLTALNISGNTISSLSGVSGLASLEQINISHTDINDLSPLDSLESLKKVYVSSDMLPLKFGSGKYEIILVK